MKAFYTTIVLLFVATLCGQAQTGIRYLNKQAGLTSNQVTTLEQDHHGYIWAGTANGLNRIDGHEVFTWDSPKHPLYNLPVRAIEADKEGNCLWVFAPAGLAGCFLFDTNQLLPYTPEKADSLFRYHHKGRLYMWQYGPGKRCNRIRLNKGKLDVRTFPHEVLDICTDEDGGDWLMTKEGTAAVNPKKLALVHISSRYTSSANHVKDAKEVFDGEVVAPNDLTTVEIPYRDA